MHTKNRELTSKRNKARHLIVVKGYNQKETALIVGISETTMSKWVTKYKWKEETESNVHKKGGLSAVMKEYFEYIRSTAPFLLDEFKKLWTGFLKAQEKNWD